MSKLFTVLSIVVLMTSASSFAQQKDDGGKGKGQGQGQQQKPVTWDELKARCQTPGKFQDIQVPPVNIKLQCSEAITHFVAAAPGEVPLPTHATLVTAVFSDKFTVAPEESEEEIPSKSGSCQRFVEVTESFLTDRSVSCAEILNGKGELSDFCMETVSKGKGQNPKGVSVNPTGRVIDTCGANAIQGGGKSGHSAE